MIAKSIGDGETERTSTDGGPTTTGLSDWIWGSSTGTPRTRASITNTPVISTLTSTLSDEVFGITEAGKREQAEGEGGWGWFGVKSASPTSTTEVTSSVSEVTDTASSKPRWWHKDKTPASKTDPSITPTGDDAVWKWLRRANRISTPILEPSSTPSVKEHPQEHYGWKNYLSDDSPTTSGRILNPSPQSPWTNSLPPSALQAPILIPLLALLLTTPLFLHRRRPQARHPPTPTPFEVDDPVHFDLSSLPISDDNHRLLLPALHHQAFTIKHIAIYPPPSRPLYALNSSPWVFEHVPGEDLRHGEPSRVGDWVRWARWRGGKWVRWGPLGKCGFRLKMRMEAGMGEAGWWDVVWWIVRVGFVGALVVWGLARVVLGVWDWELGI